MIHTARLDDKYTNTQELSEEIHCRKEEIRFEKPTLNDVAPEGYMTSEEFRKHAIAKVNTFCKEHGIL